MVKYLTGLRPKYGRAEIPGSTTFVDSEEQLVRTTEFADFQATLHRIDRGLHLAFDRVKGLWCIYREGWEARNLDTGHLMGPGATLAYKHPVPTVVHYISWAERVGVSAAIKHHRRRPDEATLRTIAAAEKGQYDWDNSEWGMYKMVELGEAAHHRSQARTKAIVDGVIGDAKSRIDVADLTRWKPMVSVPADIPKGS